MDDEDFPLDKRYEPNSSALCFVPDEKSDYAEVFQSNKELFDYDTYHRKHDNRTADYQFEDDDEWDVHPKETDDMNNPFWYDLNSK